MNNVLSKMKKRQENYKHLICFFIGKSHISNDGSQNYLIFQTLFKTFTIPAAIPDTITEWESTGISNENGH